MQVCESSKNFINSSAALVCCTSVESWICLYYLPPSPFTPVCQQDIELSFFPTSPLLDFQSKSSSNLIFLETETISCDRGSTGLHREMLKGQRSVYLLFWERIQNSGRQKWDELVSLEVGLIGPWGVQGPTRDDLSLPHPLTSLVTWHDMMWCDICLVSRSVAHCTVFLITNKWNRSILLFNGISHSRTNFYLAGISYVH